MIKTINAVLVTHTHRDHWDSKAIESIDKKHTNNLSACR